MQTWIFQGNPEKFEIDDYLKENKKIWWTIRQRHFIDRIQNGDEVFIWRSDGKNPGSGGIVAKTEVIGPPQESPIEKDYSKVDDWGESKEGVPLKVLELRLGNEVLKRELLEKHPTLKEMQILKVRNQTNYLLTKEQSKELGKIWRAKIRGGINFEKLQNTLNLFKSFRENEEKKYLEEERNYKIKFFDFLGETLREVIGNPVKGTEKLYKFLDGDREYRSYLSAIDNLLGYQPPVLRSDFRDFLKDKGPEEFSELLDMLLNKKIPLPERLRSFRKEVNDHYKKLFEEGKFPKKKRKPNFSTMFSSILLAAYDYQRYTLHKANDYSEFLDYIEVPIPGPVEEKYEAFIQVCKAIKNLANEYDYPIEDMVDAHNLIFMWNKRDYYFKDYPAFLPEEKDKIDSFPDIYTYIKDAGFLFPQKVITNYIVSLSTKPFVILTGISGTGKTKMAQLVADYICQKTGSKEQYEFLPVRPDWSDNSFLLGYYNSIMDKYEVTPLLKLLLKAQEEKEKPFFIILDEMNIAKVEHYFSDFLSCLESRRIDIKGNINQEPIILHNETEEISFTNDEGKEWLIPQKLKIPNNIYITGTVNIDETTYMFSPKVLDRANTIEFNEVYLVNNPKLDDEDFVFLDDIEVENLFLSAQPLGLTNYEKFQKEMISYHHKLSRINEILNEYNMHFGYRVANEIATYMIKAKENCKENDKHLDCAFDFQIKQKVLPKFNGSAVKLKEPLEGLLGEIDYRFVESREKITRMLKSLEEAGFAAFIE